MLRAEADGRTGLNRRSPRLVGPLKKDEALASELDMMPPETETFWGALDGLACDGCHRTPAIPRHVLLLSNDLC